MGTTTGHERTKVAAPRAEGHIVHRARDFITIVRHLSHAHAPQVATTATKGHFVPRNPSFRAYLGTTIPFKQPHRLRPLAHWVTSSLWPVIPRILCNAPQVAAISGGPRPPPTPHCGQEPLHTPAQRCPCVSVLTCPNTHANSTCPTPAPFPYGVHAWEGRHQPPPPPCGRQVDITIQPPPVQCLGYPVERAAQCGPLKSLARGHPSSRASALMGPTACLRLFLTVVTRNVPTKPATPYPTRPAMIVGLLVPQRVVTPDYPRSSGMLVHFLPPTSR